MPDVLSGIRDVAIIELRDGAETSHACDEHFDAAFIDCGHGALYGQAKFSVSAEVFNLLNRHDTYQRLSVTGSADSATPTILSTPNVVNSARQVQLGARLSF